MMVITVSNYKRRISTCDGVVVRELKDIIIQYFDNRLLFYDTFALMI